MCTVTQITMHYISGYVAKSIATGHKDVTNVHITIAILNRPTMMSLFSKISEAQYSMGNTLFLSLLFSLSPCRDPST